MNRRQYLATTGVASAGIFLSGCLLGGDDEAKLSDVDSYDTTRVAGYEVPLAPIEDVYGSYQNDDDLLVLDARSPIAYSQAHIEGAELSPANAPDFDHPTTDVSKDRRIVTYCTCPHHLSTARAAELYDEGFTSVYAIDEGFGPWVENGYPVAGAGSAKPVSYAIEGETDPADAGEQVWLREPETRQQYVARIAADGSWAMHFEFLAVDDDTTAILELPDRTVERTLGELSSHTVRL